jgi:hypothetical protein
LVAPLIRMVQLHIYYLDVAFQDQTCWTSFRTKSVEYRVDRRLLYSLHGDVIKH